jgi:hypothetical protein
MKSILIIISALLLAGCVTQKPNTQTREFSLSTSPTGYFGEGHAGTDTVKQGIPFRYKVSSEGVPITIKFTGGMPGNVKILDERSGNVIEGEFITTYTGVVEFEIQNTKHGVSHGYIFFLNDSVRK